MTRLGFPLLYTEEDFESGLPPPSVRESQEAMRWAGHWVIFYPLWLGTMPALLKAFLEQTLRPGFAFARTESGQMGKRLLTGKTARLVVTMGMPALMYRWYFGAHGLKGLERSILGFAGVGPIRESLIGMVGGSDDAKRRKWLERMRELGRAGN